MNLDIGPIQSSRAIFLAAMDVADEQERRAFLDQACGGDAERRREVEMLLAADQAGPASPLDRVIEPPDPAKTMSFDADTLPDRDPAADHPTIDRYKLLEPIGEGGMGTVYMAEQTHPVRRRVALKVIKPGMDTKQVIARFEAERQALALMDHANIARVLDAGTTPEGRPYFVMELVKGIPITAYCDQARLTIPERLELFVLVCRAVQHAHQKGVIHRDLKPSNILVTLHDGVPVPKVIDFGIAKATGQSLTDRTIFTSFAQMIGTPLYMSPEQAELSGLDIDTRSDLYSLGVLLYELLTGTTPFDRETFRTAALDQIRRTIRDQDPPTPSSRLSSLGEGASAVSANRKAEPRHLGRAVRGELDWIVMKALEKDRNRRYETVNGLAADVLRHLNDQPVEAGPPSARYRLGKLAHRNRAALTTTTLVALALVAGTTVSVWQMMKAREATAEARLRASESKQVIDYLTNDIFGTAARGKGRSVTLGELLDQADSNVATRFQGEPLVEASVRVALAKAFGDLFEYERALVHAARAADLSVRSLGPVHPATLEVLHWHAWFLSDRGWGNPEVAAPAEPIFRHVLAARRRVLGPAHPDTVFTQAKMAQNLCHLGRYDEAAALAAQAEQLGRQALGPDHESTVFALNIVSLIALQQGDLPRAEALMRQALATRSRTLGPLAHDTLETLKDLAVILWAAGKNDEARLIYIETLNRYSRVYGLSHIKASLVLNDLWALMTSEGDHVAIRDTCQRLLREILASPTPLDSYTRKRLSVRLSGLTLRLVTALPDQLPFDAELVIRAAEESVALHGDWDDSWTVLGVVYYRLGRIDEALQAIQTSMARPNWEGGDDFDWLVLALIHARQGKMDEARAWYDKARNREDPVDFDRDDLKPLRDEAEALLGIDTSTAEPMPQ